MNDNMTSTTSRRLIDRDQSLLIIVDIQEKLLPAVDAPQELTRNIVSLVRAATTLLVPVVITEHCAEAIGPTVGEIRDAASDAIVLSKSHFCVAKESDAVNRLRKLGRDQAIIVGTEAHVCVLQSALGLLDHGFQAFLVSDAISSRKPDDKRSALERFTDNQGQIATTEMVIFEWLSRGDTEAFRELLPLIKALNREVEVS